MQACNGQGEHSACSYGHFGQHLALITCMGFIQLMTFTESTQLNRAGTVLSSHHSRDNTELALDLIVHRDCTQLTGTSHHMQWLSSTHEIQEQYTQFSIALIILAAVFSA